MLYCEKDIEDRGIGCVAIQRIRPGQLIIQESPSLFLMSESKKDYLPEVVRAFLDMTEDQKEGILAYGIYYNWK